MLWCNHLVVEREGEEVIWCGYLVTERKKAVFFLKGGMARWQTLVQYFFWQWFAVECCFSHCGVP